MNAEICEQKVNHGFPFVQKTITPKEGEEKKRRTIQQVPKHGSDQRTIHEKSSNELKAS